MKNKKKIYFIFHDLSYTGAPIIFKKYLQLARKNKNLNIFIFSRYYNNGFNIDNIKILHKDLPKNVIQTIFFKLFDLFFFTLHIIFNRPEVVFTNSYINTLPILVSKIFRVKTIVLVHENEGASIRFINFRSFLIRSSDIVIVVSSASYKLCESQNIPINKIHLIHNGIDLSDLTLNKIKFDTEIITLGALANWSKFKRLDLVIDFYKRLSEYNSKFIFKLYIGGGSYITYKDEYDSIKKSNPNIKFVGLVQNNLNFYSKIDGYIFFSECESYPTVLMEALFFQIPVFSLKHISSATEVLGDALICNDNIDQLVESCINFYKNDYELKYKNWQIKCLEELKNKDIKISWQKINSLLTSL